VNAFGLAIVALAIAIGLVGIVVPLLPGTLLVYSAIAVWAVIEHKPASWLVLGLVTVVLGAGIVIKYLWPVRRMRAAEVSRWSLAAGAVLAVVGFFVIPIAGLPLGFVLGIFLAECRVRRDRREAWTSTVHAIKAVMLATGVELAGGLAAAAIWLIAV
jgi:uncharacterized protein YqgC (DUF456 family)